MQELDYAWDESMRTGDEITDRQHKELIRRINLLLHAMYGGHPAEQVQATLDFLSSYVVFHFQHEEACMDRVHFPLAAANKHAHAEFIKRLASLRETLVENKDAASLIAVKMLRDLSEWLINHIRLIDARMLPYVESSSNPATSGE